MDENEKKEPEMAQEPPKPEDHYSRYMGTLNRDLPPEPITRSAKSLATASLR